MLKTFCKIMVLSVLVSVFCNAQNSYAQAEALSQKEFSRKYLPDASSVFGGDSPKVMCGKRENLCDANSQICLRCTRKKFGKILGIQVSTNIKDDGKCVSKSSVNVENLSASWPDCVADKGGTADITVSPNGFVSETERRVLGIGKKHKEEYESADGKKYMLYADGSNMTIAYGNKGFKGCEVLPVKIYNMQTCFFCPMARILFKTVNEVTGASFKNFGHSFMVLMVIVYIVWLALTSLKQVFVFTKIDIMDYFERILKQSFKFLIAFYLLMNSGYIFKVFVSPVLASGLKMGEMIQSVDLFQTSKKMNENDGFVVSGYYNIKYAGNKTLYDQIEKYLSSIQGQMAYMQSIGTSLFCVGTKQLIINFSDWKEQLMTGFRLMFLGIILTVVGLLISIVFAFYFLDAIMQLGLLGMMMPLMIAGWPFAITKSFASKGLEFLLNTFFVFFFTGFVVSVNVVLIDQSLTYSAQIEVKADSSVSKDTKQSSEKGLNGITKALHNQNIAELSQATNIGGVGFLLLIFSAFFGFKFIEQVSPIANELAGGVGIDMASKMGTDVMSKATGAATKATAPIRKAIGNKYNKAGGVVGIASGAVSGVVNKVADVSTAIGSKMGNGVVAKGFKGVGKVAGAVGKGFQKVQDVSSEAAMSSRASKK